MSRLFAVASITALLALAVPTPVHASGATTPETHRVCVVVFGVDVGPIHTHTIQVCVIVP